MLGNYQSIFQDPASSAGRHEETDVAFLHRMFSLKNKKQNGVVFALALLLFSTGVFLFAPSAAHAGFWGFFADPVGETGTALSTVFKGLLLGVFTMVGWIASIAVTIFGWAVNPDYISGDSGLLNRASVYSMWKFIRDFFNLFFILTLLYTAFTIVFQVAKDYKKTLLSLVLAALFVNFSFPITRVIIDITNVPMFYFVNQLGSNGENQKAYLGTVLSASQLKDVLIPGAGNGGSVNLDGITVSRLMMAIVFLFIFSITLLVLAVLFVVRLAALVVLLIFSSVGFAASVIPGMHQYSDDWWKKLSQYALFGPAAMLMLFVATQFFAEIAIDNTKAQFFQVGLQNSTPDTAGFISSMAMFTIPIVILWMAMGVAGSFSVIGAGAVVGQAQKFSKWAGKKVTYNNPLARGLYSGAKARGEDSKFGRWLKSPSGTEAAIKGWTKKTGINVFGQAGRQGARTELQKLKDKQIHEQMAKDKENKLSRTDALRRLSAPDEVMRISAATSLANMDNGIQSMDDLTKALDALKDPNTGQMNSAYTEKAVEIVNKADKKIIANSVDPAGVNISGLSNLNRIVSVLGNNEKAISDLIAKVDDSAFTGSGAEYGALLNSSAMNNPNNPRHAKLRGELEYKVKKEGQSAVLVDYQLGQARAAGPITPQQEKDIVKGILDSMKANEVADQASLFTGSPHAPIAIGVIQDLQQTGPNQNLQRYQEIKKQAKGSVASVLP